MVGTPCAAAQGWMGAYRTPDIETIHQNKQPKQDTTAGRCLVTKTRDHTQLRDKGNPLVTPTLRHKSRDLPTSVCSTPGTLWGTPSTL